MTGPQANVTELTAGRVLQLLTHGEIEVEGLIPWSSNATLLVTVREGDLATLAVYKPQGGERPLWDFEYGSLGMREVAAYLVCESLGWSLIPPTVLREGPHGLGSVQFFVDAQHDAHFFTVEEDPAYTCDLQKLAAFDVIANNADRKSGHCLLDGQGRLWAIDNALTFHQEPKLRTVIWNYAGKPLPPDLLADLGSLDELLTGESQLEEALVHLLSEREVDALRNRLRRLIRSGHFPNPGPGRVVPWPLV